MVGFVGHRQWNRVLFRGGLGRLSVNAARCATVERLMWPFVGVVKKVLSEATDQIGYGRVFLEIDFFVFQTSPKSFHEYVVQRSTFAVHADLDPVLLED